MDHRFYVYAWPFSPLRVFLRRLASNRCTSLRLSFLLLDISFFPSGDQLIYQVITRISQFKRVENLSNELSFSLFQGLSVCSLRPRTRTENWRNDNAALPPLCLSINLSVEKTRLADRESHFNLDHSFGVASLEESANLIITFLGVTSCSKRPRAYVDRVFHVAYLPLSP